MKIKLSDEMADEIFLKMLKKDHKLVKLYANNSFLEDDKLMYTELTQAYETILRYHLNVNEYRDYINEQT
jgi:ATP-dependent helicase/DNAse subunit B